MEYKGDEQPSLNDAGQLHSLEHSAVPTSLLPSVLSRLGLGDITSLSLTGADKQLAALKDEEISVRVAAVRSLGEQREASAIESLLAALHDSAWEVRAATVWALGKFGEQAPLEALIRATNDEDGSVRGAALRTLGLMGNRVPIEPLMRALGDSDWQVREIATLTLGEHGEQEQPRTDVEVEARVKIPSNGDSTPIQLTAHVRTLLSRVVRDVGTPLADTRSAFVDDQPVQTKPRRLRPIVDAVLAALIIAGIVASWLVIQQRLHPSQGSASTPLLAYHGHADGPAVWSSDSKYISILTASSTAGETVVVWNRATGQVTKHILHALGAHPQENQTVFAPDGKHLAFVERVTNNKVAVQVWDAIAWRSILTTYYSSPSGFLDVVWSPDSTRIVIPGEDGTMQVWNVVTGHELVTCHVPPVDYLPESSYISPEGQRVLIGYGPRNMYVLGLTTCKLLTLPPTDANVVVWSPQGNRFATVSLTDASIVQVWDAYTGRNLANFHLTAPLSELVWTSDGMRIVTRGDKEVYVLDIATQGIVLKVIPTRIDLLPVWALSADSSHIASLSGTNTVQTWDTVTGRKLKDYQSQGKSVKVVAWSPNSMSIATGSMDGTVHVWKDDTAVETYRSDSSSVLNVAWSPDGKSIATGNLDGSIWVWKVN